MTSPSPQPSTAPQPWPSVIIHADLDAFYASVEQLDDPELRGKPVLVGGSPERRGVVAACSYEARAFGVHSAMPMRTAVARCPRAVVVPPRFDRYAEVSRRVMAIFRATASVVEPASLDEAYLDVTVAARRSSPRAVAEGLKAEVKRVTGLNVSIGLAPSKSVAKIASDMDKPDGLCVVPPGAERAFLAPLPTRKLPGIGPKTSKLLEDEGVATLGELAARSEEWAQRRFGRRGPELLRHARGEDSREIAPRSGAKSVSAETTFETDLEDADALLAAADRLSRRVGERLQKQDHWGRTVTIKLRLADFTTFTRSATRPAPIGGPVDLAATAKELLRREIAPGRRFRLLGVGVSAFPTGDQQLSLL